MDVVVSALNGPARLYRNTTEPRGHWIAFRLRGKPSNRDGLGAVLKVTLPDGRVLYNHAQTSVGYACSSEPLIRFGLGPDAIISALEIRWPDGSVQTLHGVKADRIVEIEEAARPVPLPAR
jgi:hypothetical protein